jgi:hypothetical protein
MGEKKLLIYHNVIMPYKVKFFTSIAQEYPGNIELLTSYFLLNPFRKSQKIKNISNLTIHYLPALNYKSITYNNGVMPILYVIDL